MKVQIEPDKCIAAGLCVSAAERVFDQDDSTGTVVLLATEPAAEDEEDVREASQLCPALAIKLEV